MDGDFECGSVEDGGHNELGSMLSGAPYILYQPEFSVLLSDCLCMSFQLGAVFCSSQEIRGFPCQETVNRTPELEFRVYHNTEHRRPMRAARGSMRTVVIRERTRAFMSFVSWPCGGDCILGNRSVKRFYTW